MDALMAVSLRNVRDVVQAQADALERLGPVLRALEHRGLVNDTRLTALERSSDEFIYMSWRQRLRWLLRGATGA
jgi:hypothetical protein